VWFILAVSLLIPLIVLANSNKTETKTDYRKIAENIRREFSYSNPEIEPMKMGTPSPSTPEPIKTQSSSFVEREKTKSGPSEWDLMTPKMFIYFKESGNNPNSINESSGACGLGQALPCSKMPCSLGDYACQDNWFTNNYMIPRYGTWENAKTFWLNHGWW